MPPKAILCELEYCDGQACRLTALTRVKPQKQAPGRPPDSWTGEKAGHLTPRWYADVLELMVQNWPLRALSKE